MGEAETTGSRTAIPAAHGLQPIQAYPGCPTLSWLIASRVCNKMEESDAFILISAKKGAGKSIASLALAESIAADIVKLRGLGEDPRDFFNMNHIKTVTRTGILDLLTSGTMELGNRVFVLDDFSVQYSNRQFQTLINRMIGDLLLTSRIFKNVLIANCVDKSHIDKLGRGLIDYEIRMVSKSTNTQQSIFKCYLIEQGIDGAEFRRFLTWHGMRIRFWLCGKPSKELEAEYVGERRENTKAHLKASYTRMMEEEIRKAGPKEKKENPVIVSNRERVRSLYADGEGMKVDRIMRETGLSRYMVNRCLSPEPTK
jgi:hypothetical protein